MDIEINYIPVRRESVEPFRDFVLERDGHSCRYCGNNTPPFHIDHVYPVIKGGETSADNLVTACQRCNSEKHAKIGVWPKPIGHFGDPRNYGRLVKKHATIHLVSVIVAMSGFMAMPRFPAMPGFSAMPRFTAMPR